MEEVTKLKDSSGRRVRQPDRMSEANLRRPTTARAHKKRRDAATLTDFLRLYPDAKHRI